MFRLNVESQQRAAVPIQLESLSFLRARCPERTVLEGTHVFGKV